MEDAKKKCKSGIEKAEKDCDDALRAAEKWLEDAAKAIANAVKSIGSFFGRRRRHAIDMVHSNQTSKMVITGMPMRRPVTDLISREGERVPITRKIRHSRSYNIFLLKQHRPHYRTSFARSSSRGNILNTSSANQRYSSVFTLISY